MRLPGPVVAGFVVTTVIMIFDWRNRGVSTLLWYVTFLIFVAWWGTFVHCFNRVQRPLLRPRIVLLAAAFIAPTVTVPVYWLVYWAKRLRASGSAVTTP